jgi:hypothetical protein
MDNNTLELLNKKIEELVSGKSADFASYRELCGVIRGLQTAQREIGDLVRKLKDDDDN